ncbi:hypothetical protein M3P36_09275 [Altererythrobacter sp. KTW20L]|nr:hypothetical protein [Altererythrobacter sp. KTW20L]MCL6251229.1 hypothetical protein [Altererythrobacter sp. KTW20L]
MTKIHEIDMELFLDKLDNLLNLFVDDGKISLDAADILHKSIVSLFQER